MNPRDIYRHDAFYRNRETGELERKYFVVLACLPGNDLVVRLLTSRAHGRPEHPKCFHGLPYPSFYLGVLGNPLSKKSWVDLRYLDDLDPSSATRLFQRGTLAQASTVPAEYFADLLDCAARADDTSRAQERAILNQLDLMRD